MQRRTSKVKGLTSLACVLACLGCSDPRVEMSTSDTVDELAFPGPENGKSDVFGRTLIGLADPYPADLTLEAQEDELRRDMRRRREVGWAVARRALEPVELFGLSDVDPDRPLEIAGGIPKVPRWQTWYGVDDFKRAFRYLFEALSPEERATRSAFSEAAIDDALRWNAKARERSVRWPLERFFKHVESLGRCDESTSDADCARQLQSNFSGAATGNARITYSPAALRHLLGNYQHQLGCLEVLDGLELNAQTPEIDTNFSACLQSEFPRSAVVIKAQWARANFGRSVDVYDTDANALKNVIGEGKSAHWATPARHAQPTPDEIYTIKTRSDGLYRLVGLHIMTKELRHWVWVTLWWSDQPHVDFGADRPIDFLDGLDPVWANYKMAVVVDYTEGADDVTRGLDPFPTLQDALAVQPRGLTWASNPYIEHGRGNARTNCIGCHQHGGSTVAFDLNDDGILDRLDLERIVTDDNLYPQNGRTQQRFIFPTDYLWAMQRVDNLRQVMQSEVRYFDDLARQAHEQRVADIDALSGDLLEGEKQFINQCVACHGETGGGTIDGPNIRVRSIIRQKSALISRLLEGLGNMPAWAHLSDKDLADIVAYLQAEFGPTAGP